MAKGDIQPSVLLLIPAYNEEQRIGPVLRDYAEYFRENYTGEFRAAVVLNGCRDNTLGVVEKIAEEFPEIEPLNFDEPIGKGGALIEGFKKAAETGAVLTGYVDADGATPASASAGTVAKAPSRGQRRPAPARSESCLLPSSVNHAPAARKSPALVKAWAIS